ncbi:MAG: hypothetical protein A2X18_08670 [Bacteroidetes bacterium GWF2_40_14]|nr:MAG: hypothetical protein A2X18_08670 [Bacteroidetes bacterium GWF2_40_14]
MNRKIREIADIQSGVYLKTAPDGDVIYLQIKDFEINNNTTSNLEPSIKDNGNISNHLLLEGDLLFAAKGTSNFCVVYNISIGKAVASSSFFVIRIKNTEVNPYFLCWFLNSHDILKTLKNHAVGSSIPSITKSMIQDIEFELPSIEKQRLIMEISNLQKKEEELYRSISSQKKVLTSKILTETIK